VKSLHKLAVLLPQCPRRIDEEGQTYYYNPGPPPIAQWEHPSDAYYRQLYLQKKAERKQHGTATSASGKGTPPSPDVLSTPPGAVLPPPPTANATPAPLPPPLPTAPEPPTFLAPSNESPSSTPAVPPPAVSAALASSLKRASSGSLFPGPPPPPPAPQKQAASILDALASAIVPVVTTTPPAPAQSLPVPQPPPPWPPPPGHSPPADAAAGTSGVSSSLACVPAVDAAPLPAAQPPLAAQAPGCALALLQPPPVTGPPGSAPPTDTSSAITSITASTTLPAVLTSLPAETTASPSQAWAAAPTVPPLSAKGLPTAPASTAIPDLHTGGTTAPHPGGTLPSPAAATPVRDTADVVSPQDAVSQHCTPVKADATGSCHAGDRASLAQTSMGGSLQSNAIALPAAAAGTEVAQPGASGDVPAGTQPQPKPQLLSPSLSAPTATPGEGRPLEALPTVTSASFQHGVHSAPVGIPAPVPGIPAPPSDALASRASGTGPQQALSTDTAAPSSVALSVQDGPCLPAAPNDAALAKASPVPTSGTQLPAEAARGASIPTAVAAPTAQGSDRSSASTRAATDASKGGTATCAPSTTRSGHRAHTSRMPVPTEMLPPGWVVSGSAMQVVGSRTIPSQPMQISRVIFALASTILPGRGCGESARET